MLCCVVLMCCGVMRKLLLMSCLSLMTTFSVFSLIVGEENKNTNKWKMNSELCFLFNGAVFCYFKRLVNCLISVVS